MKPGSGIAALAFAVLSTGCGDGGSSGAHGVAQTQLPGQFTAGGGTSGQVIARTGAATATQPAGTPGIPQGAGGNPGGTAMGGSTVAQAQSAPGGATHPAGDGLGAAGRNAAPGPSAPAALQPTDQATQQARALAASMDAVAARWRSRASAQGWPMNPPTPVPDLPGLKASTTQSAAPTGQPQGRLTEAATQLPIRSEKLGTAPPSQDVKKATRPRTDPGVGADVPGSARR